MQAIELLLDANRGVDIPRDFAKEICLDQFTGISDEDLADIQDTNSDWYWEAWDSILNDAEYHGDGNVWRLYQDGDLFLICPELMADEEKKDFGFDIE